MAKLEPGGRIRINSPRMQEFINGDITVEDLDLEELRRGQFRDKNGGFQGKPPHMIPRDFHEAIARELIERTNGSLRTKLSDSMDVIYELMINKRTPARERLAAAQYIMERTMGKIPDKQIVEAKIAKWQDAMEEVVFEMPDEEEDSSGAAT
jgi:hypothetical protein